MKTYWIKTGLILQRELLLIYRKRSEYFFPLIFFIMVATLFPLSTTASPRILQLMGPGVLWIAVLLATVLSLTYLYRDDFNDGSLAQLMLSDFPLPLLVGLKIAAQWVVLIFPMILVSPFLALMFHLSLHGAVILFLSLLLGTPILMLLGSIGAALTVGLRNGGLLMIVVLLPLYIPTLIMASGAVMTANRGESAVTSLLLLSALLVVSLVVAPLVSSASLRIGIAYEQ